MHRLLRCFVVVLFTLTSLVATAEITGATPAGDNGLIAFESTRSGNSDIWTVDPAGGDPVQLTSWQPTPPA